MASGSAPLAHLDVRSKAYSDFCKEIKDVFLELPANVPLQKPKANRRATNGGVMRAIGRYSGDDQKPGPLHISHFPADGNLSAEDVQFDKVHKFLVAQAKKKREDAKKPEPPPKPPPEEKKTGAGVKRTVTEADLGELTQLLDNKRLKLGDEGWVVFLAQDTSNLRRWEACSVEGAKVQKWDDLVIWLRERTGLKNALLVEAEREVVSVPIVF
jgi:hypothetical protein